MSLLAFFYFLLISAVTRDHIYKCTEVCSIHTSTHNPRIIKLAAQIVSYYNLDLLLICFYLTVSSPLFFPVSGDERESIGRRQGGVRRCGPRGEHHAGQRVHPDEGAGSAKPQQSDLDPPPQPDASGGISPAQIPRFANTFHICETRILRKITSMMHSFILIV